MLKCFSLRLSFHVGGASSSSSSPPPHFIFLFLHLLCFPACSRVASDPHTLAHTHARNAIVSSITNHPARCHPPLLLLLFLTSHFVSFLRWEGGGRREEVRFQELSRCFSSRTIFPSLSFFEDVPCSFLSPSFFPPFFFLFLYFK